MSNENAYPSIRFAGFTDPWEQRKLGELMDVTSVKRIHQSDWTDSGIRFLRARDIVAASKNEEVTEPLFISIEKYDEYSAISGKVKTGDLLVTGVGSIGVPMLIKSEEPLYFKDGNIIWFKNENNIDGSFFYHSFMGAGIQNYIFESSGKGTVGTYTIDSGKKTPILLPKSKEEQTQIGSFFDNIDNLITLHQRKHDWLVKLKKAMLSNMFPAQGYDTPTIRFTGFTDPWEQCKFSDIFDYLQNNTLSRAELTSEDGLAKNVHYGDVLVKYGEYLDVSEESLPFISSQQVVDKFKNSLLHDGDVIMADTAEDETVGKCTELAGLQGFPTISGLHTIPLRPKIKFASGYLGFYMNSSSYHDQLKPLMQGIKVTSVSKNAIQDTMISFPVEVAEQESIAQVFVNLDKTITLHQRKHDWLVKLKKAMLQKLFP